MFNNIRIYLTNLLNNNNNKSNKHVNKTYYCQDFKNYYDDCIINKNTNCENIKLMLDNCIKIQNKSYDK